MVSKTTDMSSILLAPAKIDEIRNSAINCSLKIKWHRLSTQVAEGDGLQHRSVKMTVVSSNLTWASKTIAKLIIK